MCACARVRVCMCACVRVCVLRLKCAFAKASSKAYTHVCMPHAPTYVDDLYHLCKFCCVDVLLMRLCMQRVPCVRPYKSTVMEGTCLPCDAIACGLGYYRAMCKYDQTDGLCTKCPYELPPNSEWDINQPNCTWTCKQGYEKTAT